MLVFRFFSGFLITVFVFPTTVSIGDVFLRAWQSPVSYILRRGNLDSILHPLYLTVSGINGNLLSKFSDLDSLKANSPGYKIFS
jgi:hypothetical protein